MEPVAVGGCHMHAPVHHSWDSAIPDYSTRTHILSRLRAYNVYYYTTCALCSIWRIHQSPQELSEIHTESTLRKPDLFSWGWNGHRSRSRLKLVDGPASIRHDSSVPPCCRSQLHAWLRACPETWIFQAVYGQLHYTYTVYPTFRGGNAKAPNSSRRRRSRLLMATCLTSRTGTVLHD